MIYATYAESNQRGYRMNFNSCMSEKNECHASNRLGIIQSVCLLNGSS
jgi:hypothetical protein